MIMLNSIAPEILYTSAAALLVLFVLTVKLLRGAFKRKRLYHDLELIHAYKLKPPASYSREALTAQMKTRSLKKKSTASFGFIIQLLLSLILLAGGSLWAYWLLLRGYPEWALVSALIALVGLLLPVIVWRGLRNRNQTLDRIAAGLAYLDSHPGKAQVEPDRPPRPSTIPEDSILRRHYLTELNARRLAITHPYPTDSILRRHAQQNAQRRLHESTTDTARYSAATSEKKLSDRTRALPANLPEDSILRRHYLTQWRMNP